MSLIKEFEKEEEDDSCGGNTAEEVEDRLTIIVSGLKSTTTRDTVFYYFENARRSGGGDVLNLDYNDQGDAVVTFQEVKGTYFEITLLKVFQVVPIPYRSLKELGVLCNCGAATLRPCDKPYNVQTTTQFIRRIHRNSFTRSLDRYH